MSGESKVDLWSDCEVIPFSYITHYIQCLERRSHFERFGYSGFLDLQISQRNARFSVLGFSRVNCRLSDSRNQKNGDCLHDDC